MPSNVVATRTGVEVRRAEMGEGLARPDETNMRSALLDAAEELLAKSGYRETTTRAVGTLAGVNHTLIYHYFDSLDGLLVALSQRVHQEVMEQERARLAVRPFRLRDYWYAGHPSERVLKVWFELSSTLFASRPDLRPPLLDLREESLQLLIDAIEDGVAAGSMVLAPGVTARGVAELSWVLQNGVWLKRLIGEERGDAELLGILDTMIFERLDASESAATSRRPAARRLRRART